MAIEDVKEIMVRGKKVSVTCKREGIRNYTFTGTIGEISESVSVLINPHGKVVEASLMQTWVDQARQTAAEAVVQTVEHMELESQVD